METRAAAPRRRRGRPRAFDRDRALDRAVAVFWKQGFESTSIADLTAAMGIHPPSLYAAFGDKEALFLEAVDRYLAGPGAGPALLLEEEATAREGVARMLEGVAREMTRRSHPPGCMVVSAAAAGSPVSDGVRRVLERHRRRSEARLRARILRGVREGDVRRGTDAGALARFYMTVIEGMSTQARDGVSSRRLLGVARTAMAAWPPLTPAGPPPA